MSHGTAVTPDQFTAFGDLFKYLRRRAGLTQRDLSVAVGYSDSQISRLEQSQRVPEEAMLIARFVPALQIEKEPAWVKRLVALAAAARQQIDLPTRVAPAGASLLDRIVRGQLIGRASELRELGELWLRAQEGRGHLALIAGEPGIGKTRLARELQAHSQAAGAAALAGGCYEFEAVAPYLPFVEALRAWVEAQSQAVLRDKLGTAAPELARLVPAVEARLGPLAPNPQLPPLEERLRLFDNLARFFQALADPNGVLIFLDDLHWADQGTLALLHYLLRRLREARVLFLAAYREEALDRAHPLSAALAEWNRERLATRVALGRLSVAETGALLAALFGQATVSLEFSEAIHRETEGNPFFIEEVVKSLIEQGDVYRGEAGWGRKAIPDLTIPQSIKEAIGRRLNRLSARCIDVLHTAAALGKEFPFGELAAVVNGDEEQLLDALDEASRAQLVRAEGGESFGFTHDKIREVLYQDLNPIRRRRLHQRIGEGLEQKYSTPDAREAHAPDIAHHFVQSGDLQKGLTYSLAAAQQAQRLYAHDEALRHYLHAAENAQAMQRPDQLATLYEGMAEVHYQRGVYPAAADDYQQAPALIGPDDRARRAVLHRKIGDAYAQIGDERGLNFLRLAERELDPATQTDELALTLTWFGRYHHYHAQHQASIEFYERARQLAEPQDQVSTLFRIYICFAGACQHLAQYQESGQWARRAIELGERKGNLSAKGTGYQFLAENAHTQGHWEKALEYAAINREIAERTGALDDLAWPDMVSAQALYGRGDLQQALKAAQAALSLAERIGEGRVAVLLGSLLAQIETDLGHDDAARAAGELWIKRSDELRQVFMQCVGRHGLAYFHSQRGEWAQAAALHDRCAALYTPTDSRVAPLWLGPYPALARLSLGRVDEAAHLIADYLTLAREAEAPHLMGCANRVQAQIFAAQDLRPDAAKAFDESVATLGRQGSRLELGRALYHRGLLRRSLGQADAGRDDLQQAFELFGVCGAVRDRERAVLSLAQMDKSRRQQKPTAFPGLS